MPRASLYQYRYFERPAAPRATILVVCTANMCRSPLVEYMLRDAFEREFGAAASDVLITSAGTRAQPGAPMAPHSETVLAEYGIRPAGFGATWLSAELVAEADLVLCATREHRSAAVTLQPRALRRTFTLREFARLSGRIDVTPMLGRTLAEQVADVAAAAGALRGYHPPQAPEKDDLGDPVGRPLLAFRTCAKQVARCVGAIVDCFADAATVEYSGATPGRSTPDQASVVDQASVTTCLRYVSNPYRRSSGSRSDARAFRTWGDQAV